MNQDHRNITDSYKKVESPRLGVVQIIVHDSRVVQIERTEKTRLDLPCSC